MASPTPAQNPNAQLNMLSRMPSPRGKNSLRFRGKDVEDFLTEYEHAADHANLTDTKKCEEIRMWGLEKFEERAEVSVYFLRGKEDRRQFLVITASLEARNALSGYDRNDYFWSGIRPTSLTMPPSMGRVTEVATKFLQRDAYVPRYKKTRPKSVKDRHKKYSAESDDESSEDEPSDSSESSSSSSEEDSSDDDEPPKPDLNAHSNIDDLAERFKRLELRLAEHGNRDAQPQRIGNTMSCIMCGEFGHGIRDCEQSKF